MWVLASVCVCWCVGVCGSVRVRLFEFEYQYISTALAACSFWELLPRANDFCMGGMCCWLCWKRAHTHTHTQTALRRWAHIRTPIHPPQLNTNNAGSIHSTLTLNIRTARFSWQYWRIELGAEPTRTVTHIVSWVAAVATTNNNNATTKKKTVADSVDWNHNWRTVSA